MVDINWMMLGLLGFGLIVLIFIVSTFSLVRKVLKSYKNKKEVSPIYILLIVLGLSFCFNSLIGEQSVPVIMIITGIVGNVYNYKNRENKFFKLGIGIYSAMMLCGMVYLGYMLIKIATVL